MTTTTTFKTLQVRVKDKHSKLLSRMADQVNVVWNYCNEISKKALTDHRRQLSHLDLQKLTAGFTKLDGIELRSGSVESVCREFALRRRLSKKARLAWRVSNPNSSRRSLGWIPLKTAEFRCNAGRVIYSGHDFGVWDSYGLVGRKMRTGSFSQDARGRWYFNVVVEVPAAKSDGTKAIGIDLGLKTAVTCSDGQTLEGRLYRASEAKLAKAQRAGKKRLARTVHAKIKNQRKDGLHKFSTALVKENAAIFVGDVSSKAMLKTTMAKSTQDAGWAMFKTMLERKCHQAGVVFEVVKEAWSTQTCNVCGVIAGPKGRAGLKERVWECMCGTVHDRDVNAALNIRRRGLATLEEGADFTVGEVK